MTSISEPPPGTWTVDPAHSEVGFVARHLMVTKVRGRSPSSRAPSRSPTASTTRTVQATVQLASVDTGSADRDTHLKSRRLLRRREQPRDDLHLHPVPRTPSRAT